MLTAQLHPVPRLKMSEALLMLPLDAFMASLPLPPPKKENSLFFGGTDEPMEEFTCSLVWR